MNYGTISAISTGVYGTQEGNFTEAVVAANDVVNDGLIEAQAIYGNAIALSFSSPGHTLVNSGDIYAYSENGTAVGVTEILSFTNQGSIFAAGAKSAVGVQLLWNPLRQPGQRRLYRGHYIWPECRSLHRHFADPSEHG